MVEKIPSVINSVPSLTDFFEKLFPGDIYSVEIALDLSELESLTKERKIIKRKIEDILTNNNNNDNNNNNNKKLTIWIPSSLYQSLPLPHPTTIPCPFRKLQ